MTHIYFNLEKAIQNIDKFIEETHVVAPIEKRKKTFYNYNEWSGWRFYLKAIRNRDWESIKTHLNLN